MTSLTLAMRSERDRGLPLPPVFNGLKNHQAFFRRGQVSLIAAAGGGGKSAIATHIALFQDYSQGEGCFVPTMYFSADSDESTLGDRATAAVVGKDTSTVHRLLKSDDKETWDAQAAATGHIWINFNPCPSVDDIQDDLEAYAYAYGEFPHLIVIDNLMNVDSGATLETGSLHAAMDAFNIIARECNAHVMVLHHVVGEYSDGDKIIPRSGILGKLDKVPRLILTLWKPADDMLGIAIVKNSNGPQSPTGMINFEIPWLAARSWMGGTCT